MIRSPPILRYAYVEFLEVEAIPNAVELNETELHGRPLKVGLQWDKP